MRHVVPNAVPSLLPLTALIASSAILTEAGMSYLGLGDPNRMSLGYLLNNANTQGRPRDPSVDQAILRAALELFVEHGIAGASIEKIAKQAGVAKTSIYRRWTSREALLAQAIEVARNATGYTIDLLERTSPRDLIKLLVEACEVIARKSAN